MKKLIALPIIVLILTGCENGMRSAELMSKAADQCELDVRDNNLSYDNAPACKEIKTHAYRFMDEAREA